MNRIIASDPASADGEFNVLLLQKGGEKYIFYYDDTPQNRADALRCMGRFAANPELSFSWRDCAYLAQQVRAGATP